MRESKGINIGELSEKLGWGHSFVKLSVYETGKRKVPVEHLISIAAALECTIDDLVAARITSVNRSIPVLDDSSIVKYIDCGDIPDNTERRSIVMSATYSKRTIAYKMSSDAMQDSGNKSINIGDLLMIDMEREPLTNDIVMVIINENDIKIRRMIQDGAQTIFKSASTAYDQILYDSNYMKIIGVVVEKQVSVSLV